MIEIKRALISVSDKTGIVEIAEALVEFDCEIISTGGTRKVLEEAGIKVTEIQSVTGNPEAFGGRMKTISFNIESALLFDREQDATEAAKLGIQPIDLVVCNLYPFAEAAASKAGLNELIELIDIGGPTMIRAAAKNFKFVAVITDVQDYQFIINELKESDGSLSYNSRFRLMRKAFNHTADYDSLIAVTLDQEAGELSLRMAFEQGQKLRYGENSHQQGFFLRERDSRNSLYDLEVLHGKELSYNNITDIHSAVCAVRELSASGCAIIKHNNPCGLAESSDQLEAFQLAWEGDPVSAFGSIIAFNKPVELKTASFLRLNDPDKSRRKFIEVIIAPEYEKEALEYLKFHKNLRLIRLDPKNLTATREYKHLAGALLMQDADLELKTDFTCVTETVIDLENQEDLLKFGLKAVKNTRSNAIVIVREKNKGVFQLLGMGAGQPNRLISTKLALDKAKDNLLRENNRLSKDQIRAELKKTVLVSDAFFPFSDNVELAADAGIQVILQPGGSIFDNKVINTCNELNLAMIFSGLRHFKH